MSLHAIKNGVSPYDEDTINPIISLNPYNIIYEGQKISSLEGAGVLENSLADYSYSLLFYMTSTRIDRIELQIDKDGTGSDLNIQIKKDNGDGLILKDIYIPSEFIPTNAAYISIPVNLDVTANASYAIVIKKRGDSTNKLDLIGETTSNAYTYRRVNDGDAWVKIPDIHFKVFAGTDGKPVHEVSGNNINTIEYANGKPSKEYLFIPPPDGFAGGVRQVQTISYSNGKPVGGA